MKIVTENKRSRYDYYLEDKFEAGIVLMGSEIKSIITNGIQGMAESYVYIDSSNRVVITGLNIHAPANNKFMTHDPVRPRFLLLHAREIQKLKMGVQKKGMTIVPVKAYFNNNKLKIEISLARGKQNHDKRNDIAERDWQRRKARDLD